MAATITPPRLRQFIERFARTMDMSEANEESLLAAGRPLPAQRGASDDYDWRVGEFARHASDSKHAMPVATVQAMACAAFIERQLPATPCLAVQ